MCWWNWVHRALRCPVEVIEGREVGREEGRAGLEHVYLVLLHREQWLLWELPRLIAVWSCQIWFRVVVIEVSSYRPQRLIFLLPRLRLLLRVRGIVARQVIQFSFTAAATPIDLDGRSAFAVLSVRRALGLKVGTCCQVMAVIGIRILLQMDSRRYLLVGVRNGDLTSGQAHRGVLAPLEQLFLHLFLLLYLNETLLARGGVHLQPVGVTSQTATAKVSSMIVAQQILEHPLVLVGVDIAARELAQLQVVEDVVHLGHPAELIVIPVVHTLISGARDTAQHVGCMMRCRVLEQLDLCVAMPL